MNNRNYIFDAIKAFAIFLVVYAHCFVYIGTYDFWTNPIFQFIYTFHMPLFFMVSGFFFASSLRLGWKEFLLKKSIALLLPCFVWTIIFTCMHFQGWNDLFLKVRNPFGWKLWFLRGLFLVQFITYICIRIGQRLCASNNKAIFFAIIISSAVYFLPFMSVPRVMIPMLWIGYFIRLRYDDFVKNYRYIAIVTAFLFFLLLPFWTPEIQLMYGGAKIKITDIIIGQSDPIRLMQLVYRIMIGVFGSIAVIATFHSIKSVPHFVTIIGGSTASVYILQSLILEDIIGNHFAPYAFLLSEIPLWIVSAILFPLITILLIAICIGIQKLISKSTIISAFLWVILPY